MRVLVTEFSKLYIQKGLLLKVDLYTCYMYTVHAVDSFLTPSTVGTLLIVDTTICPKHHHYTLYKPLNREDWLNKGQSPWSQIIR